MIVEYDFKKCHHCGELHQDCECPPEEPEEQEPTIRELENREHEFHAAEHYDRVKND